MQQKKIEKIITMCMCLDVHSILKKYCTFTRFLHIFSSLRAPTQCIFCDALIDRHLHTRAHTHTCMCAFWSAKKYNERDEDQKNENARGWEELKKSKWEISDFSIKFYKKFFQKITIFSKFTWNSRFYFKTFFKCHQLIPKF